MTTNKHVESHNNIEAECASTTAAAVANAFLDIQSEDKTKYPPIDQMKLQKLVFYAHAWWLAIKGRPLFGEEVEAWPWGPVIRDVYEAFRSFGRLPIQGARATSPITIYRDNEPDIELVEPEKPNGEIMEFLRNVWESHKKFTGIQLSNATHISGEPWTIIKDKYGSLESKPRIPNTLIQNVFKNKLS